MTINLILSIDWCSSLIDFNLMEVLGFGLSIFGVVFVYKTLNHQKESTKAISHDSNFILIYREIEVITEILKNFEYIRRIGSKGLYSFSKAYSEYLFNNQNYHDTASFIEFKEILESFYRLYFMMDSLGLSENHKRFIRVEIAHVYSKYLLDAIVEMKNNWKIPEHRKDDLRFAVVLSIINEWNDLSNTISSEAGNVHQYELKGRFKKRD